MARKLQSERGGGPKSPIGKGRSSQNARTHGVLSKLLILEDERLEDYQAVERGWQEQFEPADYQEERLVQILVHNDWMLRRAERRFLGAQAGAATSLTSEEQHRLELMQRYRTAAERSFYRAWNALRGLKRDLERAERERAALRAKINRLEAQIEHRKERAEAEMAEDESGGVRQREPQGNPPPSELRSG